MCGRIGAKLKRSASRFGFFDLLLSLHRKKLKVGKGMIDDHAALPIVRIGLSCSRKPQFDALRTKPDRCVIDCYRIPLQTDHSDSSYQICLKMHDFTGIDSDPGAAFETRLIGRIGSVKRKRPGLFVFLLLKPHDPRGLLAPGPVAFAAHVVIILH